MAGAVLLTAAMTSPGSADPGETYVTEWNRHANNAIYNGLAAAIPGAANPAYLGAIHMAMVQGAVYDAVNDIVGGYQPYRDPAGTPPADASQDAATVTAAYDVLIAPTLRLPDATKAWLLTEHTASMGEIAAATTAARFDAGVAVGHAAASAMLGARIDDGRFPTTPFFHPEGLGAGQWRPVSGLPDQFAWVGNVTPFTFDDPAQFRTEGPQALASDEYLAEYNEVKSLGSSSAVRTPAQQAIADFFQPNPIEMFNRNFRDLAELHNLSVAAEARFLAVVNLAAADALISCWNDKSFHHFWRPITAIRNGEDDTNLDTVGDPFWTPFIGTPPYPDHASGYNCASGAMMNTAADFFGTNKFDFSIARSVGGTVRNYTRFTDVVKDTIDARVLQGIHFRSADVQGANIGKHVAHWLDKHVLQPVD
jgi:hypothetical protein